MADNSLALGIRPMAVPDYAGDTMNRVNMMGALAKMDEYRSGVAEKNALAQLVTQPGFDPATPESQNMILRAAPLTGPGILEGLTKARTANVGLKSAEFKLQTDRIDTALKDITAYTTAADTLAGIQKHLEAGDIDQAKATALVNSLNAAPSFEAWQMGTVRGLLDAKDRLAQTFTSQNLGGSTRVIATPTLAGGGPAVVVPGSTGTVTATADAIMAANTARRGQDMTRDAANAPNVVQTTTTDATGKVHFFNRFGQEIGSGVKGAGKPSGDAANVSEQAAAYNTGRITTAMNEIRNVVSRNPSAAQPGLGEAAAGLAPIYSAELAAWAQSANKGDRQIVSQSMDDALDALLFLATGAAYNKEQLEQTKRSYKPSYLDTPEALASKATRLASNVKAAAARAGRAWTPEMNAALQLVTGSAAPPASGQGQTPPTSGRGQARPGGGPAANGAGAPRELTYNPATGKIE